MRDPALRVERAVDWIDDDIRPAVAELPDLLRDDRHVVDVPEARKHDAFRRGVDRRCLVAAHAGADDGLAFRTRRQLREHVPHVLDRLAAEREPVSQADGRADPT